MRSTIQSKRDEDETVEANRRPIFMVMITNDEPKVDERGVQILIGWTLVVFLILTLSVLALRLAHPHCELMFIDSQRLKAIISNHWQTQEPFLSHDSDLLIRLSAHLEYKLRPGYNQSVVSDPSIIHPNDRTDVNLEKKFIVLDLEHLSIRGLEDNRYKLKFNSNCSVISMILVRKPNMIFVDHISVNMRISGEPRRTCELALPEEGAFSVNVNPSGLTHYFCDQPDLLKFSCFERKEASFYSPIDKLSPTDIWVADLQIHQIEFETKDERHELQNHELNFESPVSRCIE